jgi:hypothetical protein
MRVRYPPTNTLLSKVAIFDEAIRGSQIARDYQATPWGKIELTYANSPSESPMHELTCSIIDSGLHSAIYAVTQMRYLLIFQTPLWNFGSQILKVDLNTDEIEFSFQDYRKRCPADEAFETLVFILSDRLGWIRGISLAPSEEQELNRKRRLDGSSDPL